MKRMLILIMCCLLLTACTQQSPDPTRHGESPQLDSVPTETSEITTEHDTDPTTTEPENYAIYIYLPNENLDGFIEEARLIHQLDGEAIVAELVDAGILANGVSVNSLIQEENTLYIDMNEAFREQICSQGTTGEMLVMGSLVNTFLRAYGAEAVEITVNGEVLESGHVIYDFPLTFFQTR